MKLIRAEADFHKSHPDGKFCTASIRNAERIASLLGHKNVAFISQVSHASKLLIIRIRVIIRIRIIMIRII